MCWPTQFAGQPLVRSPRSSRRLRGVRPHAIGEVGQIQGAAVLFDEDVIAGVGAFPVFVLRAARG